jgi:hypothetical protein
MYSSPVMNWRSESAVTGRAAPTFASVSAEGSPAKKSVGDVPGGGSSTFTSPVATSSNAAFACTLPCTSASWLP